MTKQEYLDAAEETLVEREAAKGKEWNGSLDAQVNLACQMALMDVGVRSLNQPVQVLEGNHAGLIAPIVMIDWNEAAVRLKGCPVWFCVWGDPGRIRVVR